MKINILTQETKKAISNKAIEAHTNNVNQPQTPIDVVLDIINNIDLIDKDIVTINPDIYVMLLHMKTMNIITYRSVTLVTESESLRNTPNVIYVESFKETKLNKKFNVAILNSPYVSDKGKQIGWDISSRIYSHCDVMAAVLPMTQLQSAMSKKKNNITGLYKFTSCTDAFGVEAGNINVFYFDRNVTGNIPLHTETIKERNIASLIRMTRGVWNDIPRDKNERYAFLSTSQQQIVTPGANQRRVILTPSTHGVIDMSHAIGAHAITTYAVAIPALANVARNPVYCICNPGDVVACKYFEVSTKENALKLKEYLDSAEVNGILKNIRNNKDITKWLFEYVALPDFLK